MDQSFTFFEPIAENAHPADLAMLMVGVTTRQATSVTAGVQADLARRASEPSRFAPTDGRFDAATARTLADWKGG